MLRRHNPKITDCGGGAGRVSGVVGREVWRARHRGNRHWLYLPPLWDPTLVDQVLAVTTADAKDMARRLARQEGIFAGTSSGGNVQAAIRVARELGPSSKVATLMVDSGLKYVSTDLYRNE